MAKKSGEKKTSSKKVHHVSVSHKSETEKLLLENFVALQKVMTNLSQRFDDLTHQISELLKLFEDSAKVIVKNEVEKKKEDRGDKQLLDTMISVLDQNKVIAKGLTLMYETITDSGNFSKPGVSSVPSPMMRKVSPPLEKKQVVKEDTGYSTSRGSDASLDSGDEFDMEN